MARNPLQLFNSLGRSLQEFAPLEPNRVRLYTCGLTVYNYAHLGNLRAYVFTDTLRRVLQWKGYDVVHVMNITDVGHLTSDADEGADKMETAASREKKSVWDIAEYYTRDFQANLERLRVLPPAIWCKATDHILEMVNAARTLEERGFTYVLDDGLYFDTSRVKDYGRLALLEAEGLREGIRVGVKAGRRNPTDFVVWRRSPTDKQRLMEWQSPWGVGAPGWHLECSVMSLKYLGGPFDIHTGGVDHRQIHHVNEIAQNQGLLGHDEVGARFWLHNEFLVVSQEKMSKSKGDFIQLQTLVDWGIHPLTYRYLCHSAHYRAQLEFSFEALVAARTGLRRLLARVEQLRAEAPDDLEWMTTFAEMRFSRGASFTPLVDALAAPLDAAARSCIDGLDDALSHDLGVPSALASLGEILDRSTIPAAHRLRLVAIFDLALGLGLLDTPAAALDIRPKAASLSDAEVDELVARRNEMRRARDFKAADQIRGQLEGSSVAIKDNPTGTTWEWVPARDAD